jgi:hypothetical protein
MGQYELWVKDISNWRFLPDYEERDHLSIMLSEDGESYCHWYVRTRFWNADGSVNIELSHMVVDPSEIQDQQSSRSRPFYWQPWRTEVEGERPEEGLRRADWMTHDEYKQAQEERQ